MHMMAMVMVMVMVVVMVMANMKKKKHSSEICAVFHRLAYSIKHLIYSFNSFISTERFSIIHPIEKGAKD